MLQGKQWKERASDWDKFNRARQGKTGRREKRSVREIVEDEVGEGGYDKLSPSQIQAILRASDRDIDV